MVGPSPLCSGGPGVKSVLESRHPVCIPALSRSSQTLVLRHRNTVGLINSLLFQHQRELFLSFSPSSLLLPHYHSLSSLP